MTLSHHAATFSALAPKWVGACAALSLLSSAPALAETVSGQALGAGAPIAGSMVTLWAASGSTPTRLGQVKTGDGGRFTLSADSRGADLYLVAQGGRPAANKAGGDNPAISLMAVLGGAPSAKADTVSGDWSEIGRILPLIDRFVRAGGWTASVMGIPHPLRTVSCASALRVMPRRARKARTRSPSAIRNGARRLSVSSDGRSESTAAARSIVLDLKPCASTREA